MIHFSQGMSGFVADELRAFKEGKYMEAVPVLLVKKVVFISLTPPGRDEGWFTNMPRKKDSGTGDE